MAEMTVEEARKQGAPAALLEEYEYAVAEGWTAKLSCDGYTSYSPYGDRAEGVNWRLRVWDGSLLWTKKFDITTEPATRKTQTAWTAYTLRSDVNLEGDLNLSARMRELVGEMPRKTMPLAEAKRLYADWLAEQRTKARAERHAKAAKELSEAQEKLRAVMEGWA